MDFLTYLGAISDDETSYDVLRTVLVHFYYLSEQIDKFCMNFCKKKPFLFLKIILALFVTLKVNVHKRAKKTSNFRKYFPLDRYGKT
jgi:hypothetical protein